MFGYIIIPFNPYVLGEIEVKIDQYPFQSIWIRGNVFIQTKT